MLNATSSKWSLARLHFTVTIMGCLRTGLYKNGCSYENSNLQMWLKPASSSLDFVKMLLEI